MMSLSRRNVALRPLLQLVRGAAGAMLALTACAQPMLGQATTTASKTTDVSVFAGFTSVTPDYADYRNTGMTFGANATRYFKFPLKPGVETRFSFTHGPTVNENTFLIGPRAQYDFKRFHPYADFLFGHGGIGYNFSNPANPTTSAFVKSPGVGVDIDIFRNFQLKADYQYQLWNLGGSYTLSPSAVTFGVTWRIPFKPRYDKAMH